MRGPFQQRVYRIGSVRDGSKVGVFLYCQQHAREWTTSLTCVETAERLVRNYATDPETKKLMDNVEVFILPNVNPDGGHYSMYDFNSQRKNMTNHCPVTGNSDPAGRNTWGVDLNRNNARVLALRRLLRRVDELHQRDVLRSRPSTPSRRSRTSTGSWTRSRTSSSRTTSTPTAATSCGRRAPTPATAASPRPAPNIGIEKYFFEAGEKILAAHQGAPQHGDPAGAHGPDRRRALLGRRQLGGRPVVPQGHHLLLVRDGRATASSSTPTGTARRSITGFQPCFAGVGTPAAGTAAPATRT